MSNTETVMELFQIERDKPWKTLRHGEFLRSISPSQSKRLGTAFLAPRQKTEEEIKGSYIIPLSKHIYQVMLGILVLHSWLLLSLQNRWFNQIIWIHVTSRNRGVLISQLCRCIKRSRGDSLPKEGPAVWSCHNLKPTYQTSTIVPVIAKSGVDSYEGCPFLHHMIIHVLQHTVFVSFIPS